MIDGIDGIDGILGLGPPSTNNGPSFVNYLADEGVISDPIVSFQITTDKSIAQFGYIDTASYKGEMVTHHQVP